MEDSSSCSEMGKEAVMMMENRGANMDPNYFAVGSKR